MALIYMTHTEPVHAMGDRGGAAARDHRELYAGHLQHLQAVAVARMKYYILPPGLVEVQAAVGEHAVDVEAHEADLGRPILYRLLDFLSSRARLIPRPRARGRACFARRSACRRRRPAGGR